MAQGETSRICVRHRRKSAHSTVSLANFKLAAASFTPLGKRAVPKAVAAEARARAAKAELDQRTA